MSCNSNRKLNLMPAIPESPTPWRRYLEGCLRLAEVAKKKKKAKLVSNMNQKRERRVFQMTLNKRLGSYRL